LSHLPRLLIDGETTDFEAAPVGKERRTASPETVPALIGASSV